MAGPVWLHCWAVRRLPHFAGFLVQESGRPEPDLNRNRASNDALRFRPDPFHGRTVLELAPKRRSAQPVPAPSTTSISRFGSRPWSVSTTPLGQRISRLSTRWSPPRPKVATVSLCEQ